MEHLLKLASKVSENAEVYSLESRVDAISFENARLKDIESTIHSGLSLRIIKNGILGFAYTRNLTDREALLQNALDSLKGGVKGQFNLPSTKDVPYLDAYDSSVEATTNSQMVEEGRRVCELLSEKTSGQINVSVYRTIRNIRLINNSGSDLSQKFSGYHLSAGIVYPYTSASLQRSLISKSFKKADDDYLNFLADTYNRSLKEAAAEGGKMKVLFLPETVYVLMWRLQNATNGQSIYQKISPLAGKIGEKIFSENLSVYNDPLDDSLPHARAFDDEGMPCNFFPVVEKGILKNFYYDLYYAYKLNTSPTGHGFKGSIFSKPQPLLDHLCISHGDKRFSKLLQSIDHGIIIAGALGAHSGNIPNGDFSIGVSPALYVKNGEIAGNVKDVMAAGNIYETLKYVISIEDTLHPCYGGNFPSLLIDNVNVTIKK